MDTVFVNAQGQDKSFSDKEAMIPTVLNCCERHGAVLQADLIKYQDPAEWYFAVPRINLDSFIVALNIIGLTVK